MKKSMLMHRRIVIMKNYVQNIFSSCVIYFHTGIAAWYSFLQRKLRQNGTKFYYSFQLNAKKNFQRRTVHLNILKAK